MSRPRRYACGDQERHAGVWVVMASIIEHQCMGVAVVGSGAVAASARGGEGVLMCACLCWHVGGGRCGNGICLSSMVQQYMQDSVNGFGVCVW